MSEDKDKTNGFGGRGSAKQELIDTAYLGKPGQRGIIDPAFKPATSESLLRKESAVTDDPEWKKDKWRPRKLPALGWINGDAFKMYKYRSETTGLIEWIWNSRDGVVPYIIRGLDGSQHTHVDFWEDLYVPNWVPLVGTRIFADRPDFEEAKHQFNVRTVTVDMTLHSIFLNQASFTPWRPNMMPKGFA